MDDLSVDYPDLEKALLGAPATASLVCGLVLDALHSLRVRGKSSRGLALILEEHEDGLAKSDERMEGIVDALREFQVRHRVHHSVLDQLLAFVQNECVSGPTRQRVWVTRALDLLATSFDLERLRSLLDTAVGPFEIASCYVPAYVKTVEQYARAAAVLEPHFEVWARPHLRRLGEAVEKARREHHVSVAEYATRIRGVLCSALATPEQTGRAETQLRRIAAAWRKYEEGVSDRRARSIEAALGLSVVVGVVTLAAYARPYVVGRWSEVEPLVWLLQAVSPLLALAAYWCGLRIDRRFLRGRLERGLKRRCSQRLQKSEIAEEIRLGTQVLDEISGFQVPEQG